GPKGNETTRAIVRAVSFGFETARVAYNSGHADQIELVETQADNATITTLANDKGFPPGFRPSFAFKEGYLLLATSPEAIARFHKPKLDRQPMDEAVLARFSASGVRTYLQAHRDKLAKFLATAGQGEEKELLKLLDQFGAALELVDR